MTTFTERIRIEAQAERQRLLDELKKRNPDIFEQLAEVEAVERSLLGVTEHVEIAPPTPEPPPADPPPADPTPSEAVVDAEVEDEAEEQEVPLTPPGDEADVAAPEDKKPHAPHRRGRTRGLKRHATLITDEALRDYICDNYGNGEPFSAGAVAKHFDVAVDTASRKLTANANGAGMNLVRKFGKGAGTRFAYVTRVDDPLGPTTRGGRGDGPLGGRHPRLPRRGTAVPNTGREIGRSGKPSLDKKRAAQGKRVRRVKS